MAYRKYNDNGDGRSAEDRALDRFADLMVEKIKISSQTGRNLGLPRAA